MCFLFTIPEIQDISIKKKKKTIFQTAESKLFVILLRS